MTYDLIYAINGQQGRSVPRLTVGCMWLENMAQDLMSNLIQPNYTLLLLYIFPGLTRAHTFSVNALITQQPEE